MKLYLLGDWAQAQSFIAGLKIQEALLNWLFVDNRWLIAISLVVVFAFSTYLFLKEKKFGAWASTIVLFTFYIAILGHSVPVTMHTPAMSSLMSSSISQAKVRVSAAQNAVIAAQNEPGQPNVMAEKDRLSSANLDLEKLQKLDVNVGSTVAHANVLFAFYYTMVDMIFLNAWEVFDSIDQTISVKDRGMQSAITDFMANDPQLSATEKSLMNAYSECLIAKQTYVQQVSLIGQNVSKGVQVNASQDPPLKGKELADAWATVVYPSKEKMDATCKSVSTNFGKTIDAGISQSEIDDFKGGFSLFGHRFGGTNQAKYLAGTLGIPKEKLIGMSEDDIARAFYRSKKLEAMGSALRDKMADISGSSAGAGLLEKAGIKASVGGWFTQWLGDFMLSAKPFLQDSINFIFFLLPIAFFFTILASFIPKYNWEAHKAFMLAFTFVFAWQFTILVIEKSQAAAENANVGAMSSGDGVLDYAGNFITGSWDQLIGPSAVDLAAGGAVAGKAAMTKAGQAAISKMLFLAKTTPQGAIISSVGAASFAVGTAGYNAAQKLNKENAEFNNLLMAEGSIDPGFTAIADGVLQSQRRKVEAAKSRGSTLHAILLLSSPFIALLIVFGSFAGLTSVGGMAGQTASSVGGSIASMATQGIGRGGR